MAKNISNKQTFEQGAVILIVAAIISKLISALFKIPLSSNYCLGDLGFGYFSAAYDLISPIILLSVSGLPVAVSKIISEYSVSENNAEINKVFCISRRLFLFTGIVVSFFAAILILSIAYYNNWNDSVFCFLAIVPTLVFSAVSSAYRGYYEGVANMLPPAVSSLIEAVCKLILGFGFAFATVKTTDNVALAAAAALLGITLGSFFSCIYLHFRYKKTDNIKHLSQKSDFRDKRLIGRIAIIALPIALYSFSGSVVGLIDSITVRGQLSCLISSDNNYFKNMFAFSEFGEGISKGTLPTILYGIRSKAYTLYNIVPTLTAFLGVSAVPHITMALGQGESATVKKNCIKAIKLSAFFSFPAGIGLMALNNEIIYLLYGENASSDIGSKMLFVFGIAAAFSGVALVMGNVLQALGRQNVALINVGMGVLAKIIFNLILCSVPSVNIYGSAISTVICFILIFILNFIAIKKAFSGKFSACGIFIKLFLSSMFCGLTAFALCLIGDSSLITLCAILLAVIVYFIFIDVFKVFSKEEIAQIPLLDKFFNYFDNFKT